MNRTHWFTLITNGNLPHKSCSRRTLDFRYFFPSFPKLKIFFVIFFLYCPSVLEYSSDEFQAYIANACKNSRICGLHSFITDFSFLKIEIFRMLKMVYLQRNEPCCSPFYWIIKHFYTAQYSVVYEWVCCAHNGDKHQQQSNSYAMCKSSSIITWKYFSFLKEFYLRNIHIIIRGKKKRKQGKEQAIYIDPLRIMNFFFRFLFIFSVFRLGKIELHCTLIFFYFSIFQFYMLHIPNTAAHSRHNTAKCILHIAQISKLFFLPPYLRSSNGLKKSETQGKGRKRKKIYLHINSNIL